MENRNGQSLDPRSIDLQLRSSQGQVRLVNHHSRSLNRSARPVHTNQGALPQSNDPQAWLDWASLHA